MRSSSTVTVRLQVSGQSSGQTLGCSTFIRSLPAPCSRQFISAPRPAGPQPRDGLQRAPLSRARPFLMYTEWSTGGRAIEPGADRANLRYGDGTGGRVAM